MESYYIQPFVSGFFHLASCSQGSPVWYFVSFYGWFLFCGCVTCYLFISGQMNIWVVSAFSGIMNNAAMHIIVQVFSWIYVFFYLGYNPRSGISWSCVNFLCSFLKNWHCFLKQHCYFTFLPATRGLQLSCILVNTCSYLCFWLQLCWWVWSGISL